MFENYFDWVKALSECSIDRVYQQFRMDVEEDVKSRNEQRKAGTEYVFSTIARNGDLIVLLGGNGVLPDQKRVKFSRTEKGIAAFDSADQTIFDASADAE